MARLKSLPGTVLRNTVNELCMLAELYLCKLLYLLRLRMRYFSWVLVESRAWTPAKIQEESILLWGDKQSNKEIHQ